MNLRGLIDAVERGEATDFRAMLKDSHEPAERAKLCGWAAATNRGSLDAAKRLHDALVPDAEWFPKLSMNGPHGGVLYNGRDDVEGIQVNSANPARAWLLAILRALDDQREGDE